MWLPRSKERNRCAADVGISRRESGDVGGDMMHRMRPPFQPFQKQRRHVCWEAHPTQTLMKNIWANLPGMDWMELESHRDKLNISSLLSASQVPKTPPTMLFPFVCRRSPTPQPSSGNLSQPTTVPQIFPFVAEPSHHGPEPTYFFS